MTASLNEKLRTVKWGEYKLGDLFEVVSYKKRFMSPGGIRILSEWEQAMGKRAI